jgi:hypothetical protein
LFGVSLGLPDEKLPIEKMYPVKFFSRDTGYRYYIIIAKGMRLFPEVVRNNAGTGK